MRRAGFLLILLLSAAPLRAQSGAGSELDFLAGDWAISDASGATGRSHIVVQAPHGMIFEIRDIGGDGPLPLWFEYSERSGGWAQLFPGPVGIREFPLLSPPGVWPLLFGGDVVLQDGTRAKFRLSLSRESDDQSRRVLELSRDGGASWSTIFDYRYRRVRP